MPRPHQSKAVIHLENLCNIMGGEGGGVNGPVHLQTISK